MNSVKKTLFCLLCTIFLVGCQTSTNSSDSTFTSSQSSESSSSLPNHVHTYSSAWSSDSSGHWHASTCGHDLKSGSAPHEFGSGVVTRAATESEFGEKTYTCAVCGFSKVEPIDKKEAAHVHTYSSAWSSDSSGHWHASTCGHDLKSGSAPHEFGSGVVTRAATESEFGEKTYTCAVCGFSKVEPIDKSVIAPSEVVTNFPTDTIYIAIGETKKMDYSVSLDGIDIVPTYESLSENVAYVSGGGVVGLTKGVAIIKATYKNTVIGSFAVRVFKPIQSISFATSAYSYTVYVGKKYALLVGDRAYWAAAGSYVATMHRAQYSPADADFELYEMEFSSSDTNIVEFTDSNKGELACLSEGTAKITCEVFLGEYKIFALVETLNAKNEVYPTGIKLSDESLTMTLPSNGGTTDSSQLTAYILGDDVNQGKITWEVSNSNILKITDQYDSTNTIRFIGINPGIAIITAKTVNGFSASCTITVKSNAPNITDSNYRNPSTSWGGFSVPFGKTKQLKDSNGGKTTWTSSDDSIATIDSTGLVTGVSAGEATITATNIYGYSSQIIIRVYDIDVRYPTEEFEIDNYTLIGGTTPGTITQSAKFTVTNCEFNGTSIVVDLKLKKTSGPTEKFKVNFFVHDSAGTQICKKTLTTSESVAINAEATLDCWYDLDLGEEYTQSYTVSFYGVAW